MAAHSTDLTMFSYPVHRQTWPDIASRTCSADGSGLWSSSQRAVISMPGVQNPHCSPWQAMNPCCTGSSWPSCSRPSTVRMSRPLAMAASAVQDFSGAPSSHSTQAPQLDVSQPQWLPVSSSSSRMKWMSSIRGSTSRVYSVPLTVIVISTQASWPRARAAARRRARVVSSPVRWRL